MLHPISFANRIRLQPPAVDRSDFSALLPFRRMTVTLMSVVWLFALLCLTGCQTTSKRHPEITPLSSAEPQPVEVHVPAPLEIRAAPPEVVVPQVQVPVPQTPPPVKATPPQVSQVPTPTPKPFVPKKVAAVAPNYKWTRVPIDGPYIALTFDDGPNPKNTPALLDILKQRQIPATFFVLGPNAAAYPSVLERMVAEGHEIAIHGWDHASFLAMTPEERVMQVQKSNDAIKDAVGRVPTLVRPPYGATNLEMNRWLTEQMKMTVVLWSVDSKDWQSRDPVQIKKTILADIKPGSIVLAHDIYRTTVSAMPATLDALIAKGYKFVTVSDLISLPPTR